jgi:hypothetical protein
LSLQIQLKLQKSDDIVGGIYSFELISKGNEEYNTSLNSGNNSLMIFGLLFLIIALIGGAVVLIPKKDILGKRTKQFNLPPIPPLPNQSNMPPPIAGLPKNITKLPKKPLENDLPPQAKEKIEQYVKQLISTGYPEDKAREHAMKHKDKFLKLK